MGSDLKEMKYRRRIGVEERPQCSDPRGGADWAALQQDPVELLRKLDELRDQITRSCNVVVGQPREHRRVSRRAVSMLPEHLEPPPLPGYHRSRYGGRYGHGLPPPSPYAPPRPEHGERYARQSSGHYRQYPPRHCENGGMGPGTYHHHGCACPHCLHGQRTFPQEENIPMARYFAGQHESYRLERSPSVSSDYDRGSVASSLYSHRSVSKMRAEYFRKKAEHICRPVDGAAPFSVCSSCYKLLLMPMEKCVGRKQNRFQCGSCCQIISLKHQEENGIPFALAPSSSLHAPEMEQSTSDQMRQDSVHQRHEDFNFMFNNSNDHCDMQNNMDFTDDNSLPSTASNDRIEIDKECGSTRSIQSKAEGLSFSPSRSVDIGSPKDILCERDKDSNVEPSSDGPLSPRSPTLEDKLVDPLCAQEKGNDEDDQGTAYRSNLTCKGEYDANDEYDGDVSTRSKPESNVNDKDTTEGETSCRNYKEDNCCNIEDSSKTYEQNSGEDDTSSLVDGNEKYESMNTKDDDSSPGGEDTCNRYEPKVEDDENCVLGAESISNNCDENNKDAIKTGSISERHEELIIEEENEKLQQAFIEDANSQAGSGSSINERTNSGFSRGSSEAGLDEDQSSTGKSGDSSFFAGFLKKGFKDLSLLNKSMDSVKVSINGHPISERALKKAEKKAGPVDPGSYWYDYRAGFWGVMGRECIGIVQPFIREFNYPMARNCAGGDSGVFVNGRELHQRDLDLLVGRGLPRTSGKSYSLEMSGNVIDEDTGKKLRSLGKLALGLRS
ncbi:Extra-large G-protein-like [Zea mays]|uniref:Extra-large G-protein-like n=3 Tax=Zea mays TaxID=4577 RepID=A0A1D6NJE3_MAIZE|nr:Extra-large G-protein-like [Zea mays]